MHNYFYATTVNILMGCYTPQDYSHGALEFFNAMLMQKCKYAKEKNGYAMRGNKYAMH
jgi:hypothetical protein